MEIKILGVGCSKCEKTEKNAREAIQNLGVDANIIKVEDLVEIMQYGVMTTPAIVINGKLKVASHKAISVKEMKKLIEEEL